MRYQVTSAPRNMKIEKLQRNIVSARSSPHTRRGLLARRPWKTCQWEGDCSREGWGGKEDKECRSTDISKIWPNAGLASRQLGGAPSVSVIVKTVPLAHCTWLPLGSGRAEPYGAFRTPGMPRKIWARTEPSLPAAEAMPWHVQRNGVGKISAGI